MSLVTGILEQAVKEAQELYTRGMRDYQCGFPPAQSSRGYLAGWNAADWFTDFDWSRLDR